jgi:FdhD protein
VHQDQRKFRISRVQSLEGPPWPTTEDWLAIEEPLEIRLLFGPAAKRQSRSLSVTMRTPGNDFELAAGFLVSESIIKNRNDLLSLRFLGPFLSDSAPDGMDADQLARFATVELPQTDRDRASQRFDGYLACQQSGLSNIVELELNPELDFQFSRLQRNFYLTSSCGLCGKASLEMIRSDQIPPLPTTDSTKDLTVSADVVHQLPQRLRDQQAVFQSTGGLHAAGLFTNAGDFIDLREDVGRHNALDKLIGRQWLAGSFPLSQGVLVLSGRASFELLQKSLLARIPVVVAVGAPSSLAVELAREFNITLIGFTSSRRFNLYSGEQRIGS